jgi:hypothetical protein
VAQVFFASDEYHRIVVDALYQHYLKRAADAAGLANLAAALDAGQTDESAIVFLATSGEYYSRA